MAYALNRLLPAMGINCMVVALSLSSDQGQGGMLPSARVMTFARDGSFATAAESPGFSLRGNVSIVP